MRLLKFTSLTTAITCALFLAACSLDSTNADGDSLATEDLQVAGEILGESLSNDNSGVLLSLNDALTNISDQAFISISNSDTVSTDNRSGRGNETNYQYSYNQNSGVHAVSFDRQVNQPLFTKTVTDTIEYIFKDEGGNFIAFPAEENHRIETINYYSSRNGEIVTPSKSSNFARQDTFLINGVSSNSSTLSIDGVHNSQGTMEISSADNTFERNYELEINFLNIEINKSASNNFNFRRGVTGTQSWEMTIARNNSTNSDPQVLQGTIRLSGDGTAMLRYRDTFQKYQINLNNGDVKNQDEEFEGQVQSINLSENNITLINGRVIYLNDQTEIDSEYYPTLSILEQTISTGEFVWAEGEGFVENGRFYAEEIEFEDENESDDDDDQENLIEFEEVVTSVNLEANTITLAGNAIVEINNETSIDSEGDYTSLAEVLEALEDNIQVSAEGNGVKPTTNTEVDLIATEIEFESESDGDDDSEND